MIYYETMLVQRGLKKIIIFLVVLTTFFWLPTKVIAEGEETIVPNLSILQVAPIMNELALKPGETVKRQMQVKNESRLPLPMKAYTRAFIASDEYGGSDYPDQKDPKAVQNWFVIDEPDFILQPKATKSVNVTITVPTDARPGGHYATLFFESLIPKEVLSETSFYLSSRIGSLFFFVIAGDLREEGHLEDFKTESFWQKGPIDFEVGVKNLGNVDIRPSSTVTITNWRGEVIANLKDEGQRILPEKIRRWKIKWDTGFNIGIYKATIRTLVNADLNKYETKEIKFYVFPLYNAIAILIGIILFYIVVIKGRKRIKKAFKVLTAKETLPQKTQPTDTEPKNNSVAKLDFANTTPVGISEQENLEKKKKPEPKPHQRKTPTSKTKTERTKKTKTPTKSKPKTKTRSRKK